MKILWIVNEFFPEVSLKLGQSVSIYGGWTFGLAEGIKEQKKLELHVATSSLDHQFFHFRKDKITYHVLKSSVDKVKYDKTLEPQWEKLIAKIEPDLVHIHGTEFAHGLSLMRTCPNLAYLVSIQGLVSVYSRYFYGGLSITDILKTATLRDWIRNDTLFHGKLRYSKRGVNEKEYLKRTGHVMGRTDWDFAHTKAINPSINYNFGNETLRAGFYNAKKWDKAALNHKTIFLSQASNPIKGLQQVIKALPLLIQEFPEINVRIAGGNILAKDSLRKKILFTGFARYIERLSKKLNVLERISFIGSLTEEEMIREYQNASVFICPSSIENSPNSLGEAQLIGTPSIASFVGGNNNMIIQEKTGFLYRFEEYEILASYIKRVFNDSELAMKLSTNGVIEASKRHNPTKNKAKLLNTYGKIISKSYTEC